MSFAMIYVDRGAEQGAWVAPEQAFEAALRFPDGVPRGVEPAGLAFTEADLLPIKVSPNPAHWAKLMALIVVDHARIRIYA